MSNNEHRSDDGHKPTMAASQARPVLHLDVSLENPLYQKAFNLAEPTLNRLLHLKELNDVYDRASKEKGPAFLDSTLRAMDIQVNLSFADAQRLPQEGPLIVVANHPFGGVEGIILGSIMHAARADSKLLANYILARIPEMRELIIQVDPFGTDSATKKNIGPLKEAIRWVKNGGCLGVFPAGEVSSLHLTRMEVTDPPWSPTIGRIARSTGATVVPVYFSGRNGLLFQLAGLLHPRLRTLMLPREFLRRQKSVIDVRIGSPIPSSKLKSFDTDAEAVEYMRTRTYILKHRLNVPQVAARTQTTGEPLAQPMPPEVMEKEIGALDPQSILFENDEYTLFIGSRLELPNILLEVGRLREETFREVGEGTGMARDLDSFDDYYIHLCLWHRRDRAIVGAYRLGPTDQILPAHGSSGLYTDTLFRYQPEFLRQITPALEVGRSFVRRSYQRSYFPLMTLWKGIGQYVSRHPQYRFLFGPVSISNSYTPFSRSLLVKFLNTHASKDDMAHLVQAKLPPKVHTPNWGQLSSFCKDIEDIGSYITEVESDQKGVPVLLRQYLKLGGKILGFNVDPAFANALDGLIIVDLLQTDIKILSRYMGPNGCKAFLEFHKVSANGCGASGT